MVPGRVLAFVQLPCGIRVPKQAGLLVGRARFSGPRS